jgi:hypothetical protein
MTVLKKPVRRVIDRRCLRVIRSPLIVEITETGLLRMWEKRMRKRYEISLETLYLRTIWNEVQKRKDVDKVARHIKRLKKI